MPAVNASELVNLLFLRHAEALHGYVVGLTGGDTGLADDVVQEVFLVVSRRADDFRQDADFPLWIRGIARNTVKSEIRKRGRACLLDETLIDLVAESEEPNYPGDGARRQPAMTECIDGLAPKAREIVRLRYDQELMPMQIAERLRWSVNAVSVALSRARRVLRDCLEHRAGLENP